MELLQAMKQRHSVRAYTSQAIEGEVKSQLFSYIEQCNAESGLHMQLILNEPKGFGGTMARYGKFTGVNNYIAIVGKKGKDLEEKAGYYGEKVVLKAQQLGLNTCWVALTYSKVKTAFKVRDGEKLCLVIAIGYGETQGVAHRVKDVKDVMETSGEAPAWFIKGVEAALLAPTATNQQKFVLSLKGDTVSIKAGLGFYTKIDLGIVKYHFELGAGQAAFKWKQ